MRSGKWNLELRTLTFWCLIQSAFVTHYKLVSWDFHTWSPSQNCFSNFQQFKRTETQNQLAQPPHLIPLARSKLFLLFVCLERFLLKDFFALFTLKFFCSAQPFSLHPTKIFFALFRRSQLTTSRVVLSQRRCLFSNAFGTQQSGLVYRIN